MFYRVIPHAGCIFKYIWGGKWSMSYSLSLWVLIYILEYQLLLKCTIYNIYLHGGCTFVVSNFFTLRTFIGMALCLRSPIVLLLVNAISKTLPAHCRDLSEWVYFWLKSPWRRSETYSNVPHLESPWWMLSSYRCKDSENQVTRAAHAAYR